MYFLALVTGDASATSDDSTSESKRAEQSFRQTLFQLAPGLRDFERTQIEWHVLNFCHLDTPGYKASMRNYGLPQLILKKRFRAELTHFRIQLQERLERYERSW